MRALALWVSLFCATSVAADARVLVDAALSTLGGADRIDALDGWLLEGKGRENLSAELQGLAHDEATWREHEERVAVVRAQGAVAWERKTPRNDWSMRRRRFIYTPEAFGVVDFVTGSGSMRPMATSEAARLALMRRVPHLLLLEAARRGTGFVEKGGRRVEVTLTDAKLTLRFTRAPVLLSRVEYAVLLPGIGDATVGWEWRGWKKDARLGWVPAGHRVDVNGVTFQEVAYTRFTAGAAEAAEMMKVASMAGAGLRPADRPVEERRSVAASGPAVGEVAPGVHVAALRGFNVLFVELESSVVLFDAPASAVGLESIPASNAAASLNVARELVELIAKTCPGKPVRYIVVSHHHGDHIGGLGTIAAAVDGPLTVLVTPGDVAVARRAVRSRKNVTVEAVRSRRAIEDRVVAINVGSNPHTRENLFAWLPQEKIVLDGDLFYFEEDAPFPPSGRETMNRFFARWLREHNLQPERIYGVHYSGAAGQEALERAIGPD